MPLKSRRFDYVAYDEVAKTKQQNLKNSFQQVEELADLSLPDGRPKSLVLTFLELAYMWTGKAIRDEQIERDASTPDAPARTNE